MIRTTSFIGLGMMLVLAACTPSTPLPSPSSSSSSSSALSQPSETAMLTYVNKMEGYSIRYPHDWIVQEETLLGDPFFPEELKKIRGTKFIPEREKDMEVQNTCVFTAITSSCPNFSGDNFSQEKNAIIDGKIFQNVYLMDGAAGSVGEYHYLTHQENASHCIFLVSFTFHTTGEAYDEPIRTQVKQENAELNVLLDQIVHTFRRI